MSRALIPVILLTLVCFGLVVATAQPSAPSGCTWTGTPQRDVKTGTKGPNVLCAKQGNDFTHGAAGNDEIRAGAGRDVAVGGGGRDIVRGGAGRDRLFAVDDRGGDRVAGGPGNDQCFVDAGDVVSGCERTFRSNEPEMAGAFGSSLLNVMEIVEEVSPSVTPGPIPPPTVTVTLVSPTTVTLPPCNEGPPDPPPFCGGG